MGCLDMRGRGRCPCCDRFVGHEHPLCPYCQTNLGPQYVVDKTPKNANNKDSRKGSTSIRNDEESKSEWSEDRSPIPPGSEYSPRLEVDYQKQYAKDINNLCAALRKDPKNIELEVKLATACFSFGRTMLSNRDGWKGARCLFDVSFSICWYSSLEARDLSMRLYDAMGAVRRDGTELPPFHPKDDDLKDACKNLVWFLIANNYMEAAARFLIGLEYEDENLRDACRTLVRYFITINYKSKAADILIARNYVDDDDLNDSRRQLAQYFLGIGEERYLEQILAQLNLANENLRDLGKGVFKHFLTKGDMERAATMAKSFDLQEVDLRWMRKDVALSLLTKGDEKGAMEALKPLNIWDGDLKDIRAKLAILRLEEGEKAFNKKRYMEALEAYEKALQLDAKAEVPQLHLAVSFEMVCRIDDAVNIHHQILEKNPSEVESASRLGMLMYVKGDIESSKRHFSLVLDLDQRNAASSYGMGLVLEKNNRTKDAIEHYNAVVLSMMKKDSALAKEYIDRYPSELFKETRAQRAKRHPIMAKESKDDGRTIHPTETKPDSLHAE